MHIILSVLSTATLYVYLKPLIHLPVYTYLVMGRKRKKKSNEGELTKECGICRVDDITAKVFITL